MEQLECELEEAKAQIAAQKEELDSLRAELQRKVEEAGSWQIKALTLENESTSMRSTIQDLAYTRDAKDKVCLQELILFRLCACPLTGLCMLTNKQCDTNTAHARL